MTDKEQIMIDGCNVSGCRYYLHNLYKSCGEGLVDCESKDCIFKQLKRKEQECEELKRKVELMMDCPDCKVDEYKKALEEIEKVCLEDTCTFADGTQIRYDSLDDILDIINKADFGKSERSETRPGESCVEPVEPPIIQEAKGEGICQ